MCRSFCDALPPPSPKPPPTLVHLCAIYGAPGSAVVPGKAQELRRRRRLEQQQAQAQAAVVAEAAQRRQRLVNAVQKAVSALGFAVFVITLVLYLAGYFK